MRPPSTKEPPSPFLQKPWSSILMMTLPVKFAAAHPEHVREADLGNAQRVLEGARVVPVHRVGRDPVDLADVQSGVGDRLQDRLAGELELAARDLPVLRVLRLTDAD